MVPPGAATFYLTFYSAEDLSFTTFMILNIQLAFRRPLPARYRCMNSTLSKAVYSCSFDSASCRRLSTTPRMMANQRLELWFNI